MNTPTCLTIIKKIATVKIVPRTIIGVEQIGSIKITVGNKNNIEF